MINNSSLEIEYMDTKEASIRWGIKQSKISTMCKSNIIPKAYKKDREWQVPNDTHRPLQQNEIKELLLVFLKIQNYLLCGEIMETELSEELKVVQPLINYFIEKGFLNLKDNDIKFSNLFLTSKSYELLKKNYKINITLEVPTIVDSLIVLAKLYMFASSGEIL